MRLFAVLRFPSAMTYEYTKLADIPSLMIGVQINVYGVIKLFRYEDKKALRLMITDPSIENGEAVACNLTADPTGTFQLPDIRQIGDIIRFHRIPVRESNGIASLYGRMGSLGLSSVVWDGESGENLTPRSCTSNFTVEEKDYEIIRQLRQWLKEWQQTSISVANIGKPTDLVTLSRFPRGKYRSIFAQVIGISSAAPDHAVIRLSDGTRSPFYPHVHKTDGQWSCYDDTIDQCIKDTAVDVFAYDQFKIQALELKPREFVLIVNIHLAFVNKVPKDAVTFVVHGGAKGQQYGRGLFRHATNSSLGIELRRRLEELKENSPGLISNGCQAVSNGPAEITVIREVTNDTAMDVDVGQMENGPAEATGVGELGNGDEIAQSDIRPNENVGVMEISTPAVMTTDQLRNSMGGIYELSFIADAHNQDLDSKPAALFQWRCPSCGIRLPFDKYYSKSLDRWIRCKACGTAAGKDVPFELISRFCLRSGSMEIWIEGNAADSVLDMRSKYVWRAFRTIRDDAITAMKSKLQTLIGQPLKAKVEVIRIRRDSGMIDRICTIREWLI